MISRQKNEGMVISSSTVDSWCLHCYNTIYFTDLSSDMSSCVFQTTFDLHFYSTPYEEK